jgi:hypothetical protein
MKLITKRISRLENRVASREFQGPSWGEVLRERLRRRLGPAYQEPPPLDPALYANGRRPTWAEVLRSARARRHAESVPAERVEQVR